MKIPTPLNGWRVFAGEVGVIVLGVLLALGAQQLVEDIRMRAAVREFRKTIDHEIALNLFVYDVRSQGSACNERRIRTLGKWVRDARDGSPLPKIEPFGPSYMVGYRSAWDSRDGEVFAHVPLKARRKYAEFYDELGGNMSRLVMEERAWASIQRFALPGAISIDDRRSIIGHLNDAMRQSATWDSNMPVARKIADELGIKPIRPDNVGSDFLEEVKTCDPIFVAPAARGAVGAPAKS